MSAAPERPYLERIQAAIGIRWLQPRDMQALIAYALALEAQRDAAREKIEKAKYRICCIARQALIDALAALGDAGHG